MIKTVKECFVKVIGRYYPSHSEFVTVLSDVQKVLNNRPLSNRSQENEVDIITPNHFLVGRPIPSLLFGDLNLDREWEYSIMMKIIHLFHPKLLNGEILFSGTSRISG